METATVNRPKQCYRYALIELPVVLVPVPHNFIIHNICMKTLIVYFHAVHFLNILFLIKSFNSCVEYICLTLYNCFFSNLQ